MSSFTALPSCRNSTQQQGGFPQLGCIPHVRFKRPFLLLSLIIVGNYSLLLFKIFLKFPIVIQNRDITSFGGSHSWQLNFIALNPIATSGLSLHICPVYCMMSNDNMIVKYCVNCERGVTLEKPNGSLLLSSQQNVQNNVGDCQYDCQMYLKVTFRVKTMINSGRCFDPFLSATLQGQSIVSRVK